MRDLYRCHRHSSATRVFGVIGSPVTHSLSPVLFNDQFARDGLDAVYLPIQVDTTCELNRFLDGCRTRDWLDVAGFSVTVPHKTAALKWHRSQADALAERLGAANTLTFKAGRVTATNTDYVGAKASFSDWAVAAGAELSGMSAAVLGAGGVARAVVAALQDAGCEVTVFNRTAERAEVLAREFGSNIGQWDRRADAEADIVVNCTKLGMWPDVEVSPLPGDALGSNRVVFDTVYNPAETRLLRDARRAGCAVIDGVSMFIQQAAAQYRLWFEREMDTERARSIVSQALSGWSAQTDGPQS